MRQFQVYRFADGSLLLDLQNDFVETGTRAVAPLVPTEDDPTPYSRLEPVLEIDGNSFVVKLSEIVAVPVAKLPHRTSHDLRSEQDVIKGAVNFLFWGF